MTNQTDLATEFDTPKAAGADGIIVWGSSADVNTKERCEGMATSVRRAGSSLDGIRGDAAAAT